MDVPPGDLEGLPPGVLEEFELADRFGWRPDDIDDARAGRSDWYLAIARTRDAAMAAKRRTPPP